MSKIENEKEKLIKDKYIHLFELMDKKSYNKKFLTFFKYWIDIYKNENNIEMQKKKYSNNNNTNLENIPKSDVQSEKNIKISHKNTNNINHNKIKKGKKYSSDIIINRDNLIRILFF